MANASIRVKSKTRYDIEVNDQGEIISFDLNDPELMLKFDRALTQVKNIQNKYKNMSFEQYSTELEIDETFTEKEKAQAKALSDMYAEMRKAMDTVLGTGACKKIFGNDNYFEMFQDIFDALTPHFEIMGLSYKKTAEEIMAKYSNDDSDVI